MRLWETPVPIPNTTVKTQSADGTALETVWESRWPPDHKKYFMVIRLVERTEIPLMWLNGFAVEIHIDTGTEPKGTLRPTQSAGQCCYDNWFYQWYKMKRKLFFLYDW